MLLLTSQVQHLHTVGRGMHLLKLVKPANKQTTS